MRNDELIQAREQLGLNKAETARALGLHYNTYQKWECGEQRPPAVAVTAIELLLFLKSAGMLDTWIEKRNS